MKTLAFRLHPGEFLKETIEKKVKEENISAGCILSVVGALKNANLRMAGATPEKEEIKDFTGPFEIVSGTGTVSKSGCHIHISVSNAEGEVIGGHLKDGCVVDVTVEIVVGTLDEVSFTRVLDKETGYKELEITNL